MKSSIKINGITIESSGSSVNIKNGKVIIDGKDVTPDSKEISIVVTGNVESIDCDTCNEITINGDAGSVKTMSGDVNVEGTIKGNCQNMSGNITAAGKIHGNATTMSGNIRSWN